MPSYQWREWGNGDLICRGADGIGPTFGVVCDCGAFLPFVSEDGIDTCPKCGARYRLVIQCALPAGSHRGRKQMQGITIPLA